MEMTKHQAKKLITEELAKRGMRFKVTAKTVDFTDLSRSVRMFVVIHGWQPNPVWDELKAIARTNGFCLTAA